METVSRSLPANFLAEEFLALLSDEKNVDALPLTLTGNSMAPFLVHRRDTVYLSRITRPLKKGDVVFYRRACGTYILHRICSIQDDCYTMAGDAHWGTESGIHREQILAIMVSARRKGKLQQPGSFWWEFFRTVWLWILPVRKPVMVLYTALKGRKQS